MKHSPFLVALVGSIIVLSSYWGLAQTNTDCLACHSDKSISMEKNGTSVSLTVDEKILKLSAHGSLLCTDCHQDFVPDNLPHKKKIEPVQCFTCHGDIAQKHAFHPQIAQAVSENHQPDVLCQECHGNHDIVPVSSPGSNFSDTNLEKSCGRCHTDIETTFHQSSHGEALHAGKKGAPNCLTCHRHEVAHVAGITDSLKLKTEQNKLCLSCHLGNSDVRAQTSPSAGFIAAYEHSVHGAALQKGNTSAANCVDCHGSHNMKKAQDPTASVSKSHLVETCAKCHSNIAKEYSESIHGTAFVRGVKDAPVCTDCHGEHDILGPSDPQSRVAARNVSLYVCSPCHSSVRLTQKYGLESDRFKTFSDSYHGLATQAGSVEVANCASCHGVHNIKPSSDSTSTISKANLAMTCGKCHPGANARFTIGSVHVATETRQEPLLYWIASSYIFLIIFTIGGMFIHNLIDFIRKSRRKLMARRGLIVEDHHGTQLYVRMTFNERLQHAALFSSFITLVLTGFALKFPDAWWVAPIRNISPVMFDIRGIVHRIAAVIMVMASCYHVYYILFVEKGKQLLHDMLPTQKDISDFLGMQQYNLGISRIKPMLGRFSYIEKAEYWALVWGTIVMTVTGLILWFDNTSMGILTKLGWDAARIIHYYEAWLATLAIIVWHFYFVIFNPDVYPINLAFWKGTLTEEEMADEHPLELEAIKRAELSIEVDTLPSEETESV
jgi:cytochrome b subunit of formate dehydrogenase